MNPGDRIILRGGISPAYLKGCRGTLIRQQPGEARSIVRLDADPKARKYGGNEWCVSNHTFIVDHTAEAGVFALLNEQITPAAQRAAKTWMAEIAPLVERAAGQVGGTLDDYDVDGELVRSAVLWSFYQQLSIQLRLIAEGHEFELFRNLGS